MLCQRNNLQTRPYGLRLKKGFQLQHRIFVSKASSTDTAKQLKLDLIRLSSQAKNEEVIQSELLQKVEELEKLNPTQNPAQSDLICGIWSLLYIGAANLEVAKKNKAGTVEGPFLDFFKPITRNAVKSKGNLQLIDTKNNEVQNLAEFILFNNINGYLNIVGTVAPTPVKQGEEAVKVDVEFKYFNLNIGRINFQIPLGFVKPKGWVLTTYLDQDFRIGRGDKGSIFVTARTKNVPNAFKKQ